VSVKERQKSGKGDRVRVSPIALNFEKERLLRFCGFGLLACSLALPALPQGKGKGHHKEDGDSDEGKKGKHEFGPHDRELIASYKNNQRKDGGELCALRKTLHVRIPSKVISISEATFSVVRSAAVCWSPQDCFCELGRRRSNARGRR
jgi:hypothetical protein